MAGKNKKKKPLASENGELRVCDNRRALMRYQVEERLEAGLVLVGSEVKSLRLRRGDLEGSYAGMQGSELFLHKMHIAPYEQASAFPHEPKRSRKLLLHKRQIEKVRGRLTQQGYTLVPIRVYFKGGFAKVELGLATAKNLADKREDIKRKQDMREAKAAMAKARGR